MKEAATIDTGTAEIKLCNVWYARITKITFSASFHKTVYQLQNVRFTVFQKFCGIKANFIQLSTSCIVSDSYVPATIVILFLSRALLPVQS